MANATPEQREKALGFGSPFRGVVHRQSGHHSRLVFPFVAGLIGTINFGFGGRAKYGSILAVWLYSLLPGEVIKPCWGVW